MNKPQLIDSVTGGKTGTTKPDSKKALDGTVKDITSTNTTSSTAAAPKKFFGKIRK
jgi:hypothetical protein